jgi:glycosyltransferase involved in cell wall biosynthesis
MPAPDPAFENVVTTTSSPTAVITAEPNGYDTGIDKLMGRQSAGRGFLRAALSARGSEPIRGFSFSATAAEKFRSLLHAMDPTAPFEFIGSHQPDRIAQVGVLYFPAPIMAQLTRFRQRSGVARFSLCGVTHTTASLQVMDDMVDLLREAVLPWDALVCPSKAVVETVRRVHEAELEYLRWRFGRDVRPLPPQLPVIPLGVHCADFEVSNTDRADARRQLGLAADDVAGLFVGRLVFHAKAHPYPMLRGLQLAAERTGKRLAMIFCGWFPNAATKAAFRSGAATFAPDVKAIFLDGRDAAQRKSAWAAADLFVSLSDNIQETFGLTPIEAMAAGLPIIASDWNGYRDTVRHRIDGFLIRTLAPAAGMGRDVAEAFESGALDYEHYCWATASTTAVDAREVADAVSVLAQDPALRRRLGDAGRKRAREVFDWRVIYGQYQALWADLNSRRRSAEADPKLQAWIASAPRIPAARLDPYYTFGHYPTQAIGPQSRLCLIGEAVTADLAAVLKHSLFDALVIPRPVIQALFALLEAGDLTLVQAAQRLGVVPSSAARAAGVLAKLGLLEVS